VSLTFTDLFCGAGGSSIGGELAGAELRLGLNHWQRAIETHATNFPHADHDCEDVSSLTTARIRSYPDSDILLASPECTNHSLAKGARRRKPQASSLFEDGPAGDDEQDRSRATMWDVVRFAEQKLLKGKPYRAIVVENVVDAFKWGANDDGLLFDAWRRAMHALGYESEIVWLNSMFCPPTPQSRDRMYVVFWLRGVRRPNLRFDPPSWCPACELLVDGRQAWKKPERPWGRYGAQYVYRCPGCNGIVLPGVFPAASAIDWTLLAPCIGERVRPLAPNTRERIRRGLERLAAEPFAIRLMHGGAPRPLTLPIVTLTQRHDLAVVLPVAGNTFERTPGNRARRADVQPMDTVHGTLDRALLIPAGGSWRRDGSLDREAVPTLTAREAFALVYANRNNGIPRPADEAPARAVCTGGHIGVIVRNNTPRGDAGQMSTPPHEPFRTLTASCTQSLVVPYQSEPHGAEEPARTITTRDRLALIVPPMGDVVPRVAHLEPAPTQTTTTRAALVEIDDDDIDGCGFRMFELHEIAATMAMDRHPVDGVYVVLGNKRERMAQYGNAVTPPVMHELVARLAEVLA
jgi:DNA (cytosine-5)-methyltransferase 1